MTGTGRNTGQGHVFPRPDGIRARCGGPGLCGECSRDRARKDAGGGMTLSADPPRRQPPDPAARQVGESHRDHAERVVGMYHAAMLDLHSACTRANRYLDQLIEAGVRPYDRPSHAVRNASCAVCGGPIRNTAGPDRWRHLTASTTGSDWDHDARP